MLKIFKNRIKRQMDRNNNGWMSSLWTEIIIIISYRVRSDKIIIKSQSVVLTESHL